MGSASEPLVYEFIILFHEIPIFPDDLLCFLLIPLIPLFKLPAQVRLRIQFRLRVQSS